MLPPAAAAAIARLLLRLALAYAVVGMCGVCVWNGGVGQSLSLQQLCPVLLWLLCVTFDRDTDASNRSVGRSIPPLSSSTNPFDRIKSSNCLSVMLAWRMCTIYFGRHGRYARGLIRSGAVGAAAAAVVVVVRSLRWDLGWDERAKEEEILRVSTGSIDPSGMGGVTTVDRLRLISGCAWSYLDGFDILMRWDGPFLQMHQSSRVGSTEQVGTRTKPYRNNKRCEEPRRHRHALFRLPCTRNSTDPITIHVHAKLNCKPGRH